MSVRSLARAVTPPVIWNAAHRLTDISAKVSGILSDPAHPDTSRAEADFDKLQTEFASPYPEYPYNLAGCVQRAAERVAALMEVVKPADRNLSILELGAADGMFGALLAAAGHSVTMSDVADTRLSAAKSIRFVRADLAESVPLPDQSFDVVCSYNAFEHFPDPALTASDIRRLLRPGGLAHLKFGPLYSSPWGFHGYRIVRMPYPQFLFRTAFLIDKNKELDHTNFLNGWSPHQFDALWPDAIAQDNSYDTGSLAMILRYPECFRGRGLTLEDVTRATIEISFGPPA